jgi:site-specific DNA-methyltransferase (adenine-specific)
MAGVREDNGNRLYYGDNLSILNRYIDDASVDLVYIDPPFNSNASYNILFKEQSGKRAAAQIKAFTDTWRWDEGVSEAYDELTASGGRVSQAMCAFRQLLGTSDMLAYLTMMAPRLVELHRVLKPTGSFYLHCDPSASHYLKIILDAIFGPDRFRNEIVWQRTSAHNDPSRFGRVHDVLLFYTKSHVYTWNQRFEPIDASYYSAHDFERDDEGQLYRKRDLTAPAHGESSSGQYEWRGKRPPAGRMWSYTYENMLRLEDEGRIVYTRTGMPRLKIYAGDLRGVPYQDVWARSQLWLNAAAAERLGYATQKPLALLERIIESSSNAGDVILDAFCGCGTAITAAQAMDRRWIGIDITFAAIVVILNRLRDVFPEIEPPKPIGEPESLEDAGELARADRYQFQWWALGRVRARPAEEKKGADQGIDGRLYFDDEDSGYAKEVIISVKSGAIPHNHIRELRGVIARENAAIGVLLTLEPPSPAMRKEAASAGTYESPRWGKRYPRLQILTIGELLDGREIKCPPLSQTNRTYAKAPKHKRPPTSYQPPLAGTHLLAVGEEENTPAPLNPARSGRRHAAGS